MSGYGHNPAETTPRRQRWLNWILLTWAVLSSIAFVALLTKQSSSHHHHHHNSRHRGHHGPPGPPDHHKPPGHPPHPSPNVPHDDKINVIFMVSDGMGPASVTLARNYFEYTADAGLDTLFLDEHFIGNSRTQSSDSFVTDSAAGATAFSCALKTYNGAIGVDPEAKPCASVLEAAKLRGLKTGLVVTTRITDATPASFAAHAHDRSEEDFIAEQLVNFGNFSHPFGNVVDLLFGGGSCHFLPNTHGESCRKDGSDLIGDAIERHGFRYLSSGAELRAFDAEHPELPVMGLFAPGDLPFSIDYNRSLGNDDGLPTLKESALKAVHALGNATKDSEQGFFLMVEGSRIDHAGHQNDPGAQVREVISYSETFRALAGYALNSEVPTVVVSTSDHETGGLSVSRQVTPSYPDYLWLPEVLDAAKHSTEFLAHQLRAKTETVLSLQSEDLAVQHLDNYIRNDILGKHGLGFAEVSDEEVALVRDSARNAQPLLAQLQSVRAEIGWATHGHSGVDVNVYATSNFPKLLKPLRGGNENIDIGRFLRHTLRIPHHEISHLTSTLRRGFGDKF